jgi:hypothetical protein
MGMSHSDDLASLAGRDAAINCGQQWVTSSTKDIAIANIQIFMGVAKTSHLDPVPHHVFPWILFHLSGEGL